VRFIPAAISGTAAFSAAVRAGNKLNCWKNEADVFAAKQDPLLGWQATRAAPEQFHLAVAWIQQPGDHG
jgi:hypothetical protein